MLRSPQIKVTELHKRYGAIHAVNGVSFVVRSGEIYGLLGANGAGKTTIMRMLAGILPPTSGSIEVHGMNAITQGRQVRQVMGIVTQGDGLDESLTVSMNLVMFGHLCGLSMKDARKRAHKVLSFMNLETRTNDQTWELSGGMRRRLAIARALMPTPKVIVLDEPTTGLDPDSRHRVWEQLHQMQERGISILMSTHYMEEAEVLCDRLAIMSRGRILTEGNPKALVTKHVGERVAIIRGPQDAHDRLQRQLKLQGLSAIGEGILSRVPLTNGVVDLGLPDEFTVVMRPANLEDVFLTLTGKELREDA